MSDESKNGNTDKEDGVSFDASTDDKASVMTLTIPLDAVALDPTINGMIMLKGFFEHYKDEAIAVIKIKRRAMVEKAAMEKAKASEAVKNTLILPSGPIPLKLQN